MEQDQNFLKQFQKPELIGELSEFGKTKELNLNRKLKDVEILVVIVRYAVRRGNLKGILRSVNDFHI